MSGTPSLPQADGDEVLFEALAGGVALVRLNRFNRRNAVNGALARALHAVVLRTEADPAIRVVVLGSSMPGIFCAGADLSEIGQGRTDFVMPGARFGGFVRHPRGKPWIAMVDGPALAGGCELVLACDMVVASEHARFGLPEVKRGLMALEGGLQRLTSRLSRNVALEMIATGEPIDAQRAFQLGLVNHLVNSATLLKRTMALASSIAVNAPQAVHQSLAMARTVIDAESEELWVDALAIGQRISVAPEAAEGVSAFLEKRAPSWP
jgi:enoyl-CoA hydratase/carnithine racemase